MAMILITHDLGVVAKNCDSVAVIYAGQIIEFGTRVQVFRHPLHPYTMGLFTALPTLKTESSRLIPIKGVPTDPTYLPDGCYFRFRCPMGSESCKTGAVPVFILNDGHKCRCLMYKNEAASVE
jgi:peptide/nickel transport system ATP-binding protein